MTPSTPVSRPSSPQPGLDDDDDGGLAPLSAEQAWDLLMNQCGPDSLADGGALKSLMVDSLLACDDGAWSVGRELAQALQSLPPDAHRLLLTAVTTFFAACRLQSGDIAVFVQVPEGMNTLDLTALGPVGHVQLDSPAGGSRTAELEVVTLNPCTVSCAQGMTCRHRHGDNHYSEPVGSQHWQEHGYPSQSGGGALTDAHAFDEAALSYEAQLPTGKMPGALMSAKLLEETRTMALNIRGTSLAEPWAGALRGYMLEPLDGYVRAGCTSQPVVGITALSLQGPCSPDLMRATARLKDLRHVTVQATANTAIVDLRLGSVTTLQLQGETLGMTVCVPYRCVVDQSGLRLMRPHDPAHEVRILRYGLDIAPTASGVDVETKAGPSSGDGQASPAADPLGTLDGLAAARGRWQQCIAREPWHALEQDCFDHWPRHADTKSTSVTLLLRDIQSGFAPPARHLVDRQLRVEKALLSPFMEAQEVERDDEFTVRVVLRLDRMHHDSPGFVERDLDPWFMERLQTYAQDVFGARIQTVLVPAMAELAQQRIVDMLPTGCHLHLVLAPDCLVMDLSAGLETGPPNAMQVYHPPQDTTVIYPEESLDELLNSLTPYSPADNNYLAFHAGGLSQGACPVRVIGSASDGQQTMTSFDVVSRKSVKLSDASDCPAQVGDSKAERVDPPGPETSSHPGKRKTMASEGASQTLGPRQRTAARKVMQVSELAGLAGRNVLLYSSGIAPIPAMVLGCVSGSGGPVVLQVSSSQPELASRGWVASPSSSSSGNQTYSCQVTAQSDVVGLDMTVQD